MFCPKCGQPDVTGNECPKCGVVFSKFAQSLVQSGREKPITDSIPNAGSPKNISLSEKRSGKLIKNKRAIVLIIIALVALTTAAIGGKKIFDNKSIDNKSIIGHSYSYKQTSERLLIEFDNPVDISSKGDSQTSICLGLLTKFYDDDIGVTPYAMSQPVEGIYFKGTKCYYNCVLFKNEMGGDYLSAIQIMTSASPMFE